MNSEIVTKSDAAGLAKDRQLDALREVIQQAKQALIEGQDQEAINLLDSALPDDAFYLSALAEVEKQNTLLRALLTAMVENVSRAFQIPPQLSRLVTESRRALGEPGYAEQRYKHMEDAVRAAADLMDQFASEQAARQPIKARLRASLNGLAQKIDRT